MFLSCFMSWHCGKITVIHKFLFCSLLKIAHSPVLSHTNIHLHNRPQICLIFFCKYIFIFGKNILAACVVLCSARCPVCYVTILLSNRKNSLDICDSCKRHCAVISMQQVVTHIHGHRRHIQPKKVCIH